ncbi:MAG: chemotaxis protein CheW [Burkholderiales bacterium]|nr:chemotaxis protein CheW [Burkholderiales bacterium]
MGSLIVSTRSDASAAASDQRQYLTFLLGGEAYAIAILRIKEIIEYGQLTSVPMMPAFVRGVINLRGAVVPVVDLQARFGRSSAQVSKRTCIVIVEIAAQEEVQVIGLMVDQVNEVVEIPASDVEPAPSFGGGLRTEFIAGMGKLGGKFVVLLDLDAVLSVDELASLGHAAHAQVQP